MTDRVGQHIGRYEIVAKLGEGGMGEVYRARDTELDREVAVKVLPDEVAHDAARMSRFEREARAAAAVDHPNILAIHDIGSHGGVPFIVFELLDGEPLRHAVSAGPLPTSKILDLSVQIAEGLAAAHERGIVHRDLKPDNVFVTSAGRAKILDFGLAKVKEPVAGPGLQDDAPTVSLGTSPGTVLGTIGYMSPEQVRGEEVDLRTDIFALGCVVYEMASGRPPFRRGSHADTVSAILNEHPPDLGTANSAIPSELDRIVARCLTKRPEQRFQSAHDLVFALGELQRSQSAAREPDRVSETLPSIAVLPFANLSADPEQEYFCDGMAEEVINALTRIEGLRVVARTSSFAFKGTTEDIRGIGAKLGVDKILEGSVRKAGDRLRITAQLINVADGYHLWSERFDRRLEDVFAIQDEIALAIVDRLEVDLAAREREAVVKRYTDNLDAYSLYLKGLHHWNQLTPDSYRRSLECFQEAIKIDPQFAPAHVGIGIWYLSQCFWGDLSPAEGVPQGMAAVDRALDIDEEISEAHNARGVVQAWFERNWAAAEQSLRRSIELGPNVAVNHLNLAGYFLIRRRFEDVIPEARLAQRLDPLSVPNNAWAGAWLAFCGRYDEGVAQLERFIEMEPNQWLPHEQLSEVYLFRGSKTDEAFREAQKAFDLSGGVTAAVRQLAVACYLSGETGRGDELLEMLEARARQTYVPPMYLAWIQLARGERDAAVRLVDQAVEHNDGWLTFHRYFSPPLPGDRRIDTRLEQLGL
jgi:serine/threonine protein kinase/Tfp pilus assembly protein PilF